MNMMKKSEYYSLDTYKHLSLQNECKQATKRISAKYLYLAKNGENNTASQMQDL
jgi:hypothetical protein